MMPCLVVLVLAKPEMLQDVLRAWDSAGAPGVTVLESTGLGRLDALFGRDDLPLFPSPRIFLEHRESVHNTIFSVLDSDSLVDTLIAATEKVVGDLSQPERGILFVVPLSRVVGYRPDREASQKDS
jgi:nitrogen regulatory protein PII